MYPGVGSVCRLHKKPSITFDMMEAFLSEVMALPKKQQGKRMVQLGRTALSDNNALQLLLRLGASGETHHRLLALDACAVGKESAQMQEMAMKLLQDAASCAVRLRAADVLLIIAPSEQLLQVGAR
jgi:hypothetical protein